MNRSLIAFAAIVAVAIAQGPTQPLPAAGDFCTEEGRFAVDESNMCWYHACVNSENGLTSIPRRCALGSKISYNFVAGNTNPCTYNFDDVIGYDCTRTEPSVDGPPPCHDSAVRIECFNGGQAVFESDKCWCDCPLSWQGDFDCSKPTRDVSDLPPESNICVDGEPLEDWCNQPNMGCLNGGTCFNQCDTFWCDCPDHENNDYFGKRCELQ